LAEALADEKVWRALRQQLLRHDWVVYAKQPLGGPEQVLEYLGRYTHRVAISNERLVGMDETTVRFRVRATPGKRVLQLPAEEFIDRFLLHVLPGGFKRIRHYGLLAPAAKATKLALARQALSVPEPDPLITATVQEFLQRVGAPSGRAVPTAAWDGSCRRRRFRPASGDAAGRLGSWPAMRRGQGVARGLAVRWRFRLPGGGASPASPKAPTPALLSVCRSARFVPVTCSRTAGSRSSASGQAVWALPVT
jgi:hypothetical protein